MIDRESFDEWLAHPVTEHVLKHFAELSLERRDRWMAISWGGGNADPVDLKVLRETSQLLSEMSELKYEDIDDEEPKQSERNQPDRVQSSDPPGRSY